MKRFTVEDARRTGVRPSFAVFLVTDKSAARGCVLGMVLVSHLGDPLAARAVLDQFYGQGGFDPTALICERAGFDPGYVAALERGFNGGEMPEGATPAEAAGYEDGVAIRIALGDLWQCAP